MDNQQNNMCGEIVSQVVSVTNIQETEGVPNQQIEDEDDYHSNGEVDHQIEDVS